MIYVSSDNFKIDMKRRKIDKNAGDLDADAEADADADADANAYADADVDADADAAAGDDAVAPKHRHILPSLQLDCRPVRQSS